MNINKLLTNVNYKKLSNRKIQYLVIHYVGATGSAEANCKYFKDVYRGASAHYFIGHDGDVWQCVEDKDVAFHCGATSYKHTYCRNDNSIGIELCCRKRASNNTWYFEEETINSAIELTKELMKKYGITADNVLRHYDVTGKVCPEPYVRDTSAWAQFKSNLSTPNIASIGYMVVVTADALNVRAGAGVGYKINTVVKKGEAFTIVKEFNGWGKLKSGAGWINLKYTKRK